MPGMRKGPFSLLSANFYELELYSTKGQIPKVNSYKGVKTFSHRFHGIVCRTRVISFVVEDAFRRKGEASCGFRCFELSRVNENMEVNDCQESLTSEISAAAIESACEDCLSCHETSSQQRKHFLHKH